MLLCIISSVAEFLSRHEAKFPSARAPVSFVIETRGQRFNFVRTIGRINVGNKSQLGWRLPRQRHVDIDTYIKLEIFSRFFASLILSIDYDVTRMKTLFVLMQITL